MNSFGICIAGSDGVKTRRITLLALLAALATVGRISFNFLPNVQPVTSLIIICGIWLGPVAGIILAVLSTVLTNMILGAGLWTFPQIIAWALIGVLSGLLGKFFKRLPTWVVALYSGVMGYLYGVGIALMYGSIIGHFWPYLISSIPFDTYHAVGNVVFMILLYPVLSRLFERFLYKNPGLHNHKLIS